MTEDISEEELLLRKSARRRLVGAIALVVAAVIILPMIFDEEPEMSQQEIAIHFPAQAPVSEPAPLMETEEELFADDIVEEAAESEEIVELPPFNPIVSPDVAADQDTLVEPPYAAPIPAVKPQQKKASEVASLRSEQLPATGLKNYVVQLGAFSDHSKARQQQQNLVSHGIKAYTEPLKTNNKEMMRVRVGPFATRSAAEQELVKLRALGLDGVVTAK